MTSTYRAAALLIGLLLLVPGCSAEDKERPPRPTASAAPGRLVIEDVPGGVSANPPKHHKGPWWVTFGSIRMCPTAPLTIRAIEPTFKVQPLEFQGLVRRLEVVDRADLKHSPIISALGAAPEFPQPYTFVKLRGLAGDFSPASGAKIATKCAQPARESRVFTELLLLLKASDRGADLTRIRIEYESGGIRRSLTLRHWRWIACGTATERLTACGGTMRP